MASIWDILQGNFPAAQRFKEGYAQMPSYLQDPYLGLSTGKVGDVTKTLLGKTEQELAHEVAQKNAVKMLGLPEGNTAMDRAKALGFDTENLMYHGSNKKINEFKNWQTKTNRSSDGIFFTNDKNLAKQYGRVANEALLKKGNNIYYDAKGNSFSDTDTQNFLLNALNRLNGESSVTMDNFIDAPNPFMNSSTNPSTIIAVNKPNQIRSPFAAFDPARANEPGLLAATMAIPVSGLLQEPKKKKAK